MNLYILPSGTVKNLARDDDEDVNCVHRTPFMSLGLLESLTTLYIHEPFLLQVIC